MPMRSQAPPLTLPQARNIGYLVSAGSWQDYRAINALEVNPPGTNDDHESHSSQNTNRQSALGTGRDQLNRVTMYCGPC